MSVVVRNRLDARERKGRGCVGSGMRLTRRKGVGVFGSALLRREGVRGFGFGNGCSGVIQMTRDGRRQVGTGRIGVGSVTVVTVSFLSFSFLTLTAHIGMDTRTPTKHLRQSPPLWSLLSTAATSLSTQIAMSKSLAFSFSFLTLTTHTHHTHAHACTHTFVHGVCCPPPQPPSN